MHISLEISLCWNCELWISNSLWRQESCFSKTRGRLIRSVLVRESRTRRQRRPHIAAQVHPANSPIFPLCFVHMAICPPSNFTSLVLKEILDSFSLPGELHFEVIVHFHRYSGDPGCGFPLKRRWGGNLLQAPFRQLVAFPRVAFSSTKESTSTSRD